MFEQLCGVHVTKKGTDTKHKESHRHTQRAELNREQLLRRDSQPCFSGRAGREAPSTSRLQDIFITLINLDKKQRTQMLHEERNCKKRWNETLSVIITVVEALVFSLPCYSFDWSHADLISGITPPTVQFLIFKFASRISFEEKLQCKH